MFAEASASYFPCNEMETVGNSTLVKDKLFHKIPERTERNVKARFSGGVPSRVRP